MRTIDQYQDVMDSRDIIERVEELEGREFDPEADLFPPDAEPLDSDEREELDALRELVADLRGLSGDTPEDGITLIRDSYFADYAEELASDIGAIPRDAGWPIPYIDWDRAADALRMDYSSVEFHGVTYWVR